MSGVVWITGASSGLGRQAALEFARRGWRVAVTARSEDKLTALEKESAGFLGDIKAFPGDVTDGKAMAGVIAAVEAEMGDISTAVLNAGAYFPMMGRDFSADTMRKQFGINVLGTAHPLEHLIPRMIARGQGRIYAVASVSGYRGLPRAAAYGASKAAIINMAEALRTELKPLGVTVGVVNPGFIETPMTEGNDFPMPFLMPVEKAPSQMVDAVLSGKFEVVFPRLFVWMLKLGRMLPHAIYFPLVRRITRGRQA